MYNELNIPATITPNPNVFPFNQVQLRYWNIAFDLTPFNQRLNRRSIRKFIIHAIIYNTVITASSRSHNFVAATNSSTTTSWALRRK